MLPLMTATLDLGPFATIQNWVEAGEKKRRRAWTRTSLTGRWLIFQGTWLPMRNL